MLFGSRIAKNLEIVDDVDLWQTTKRHLLRTELDNSVQSRHRSEVLLDNASVHIIVRVSVVKFDNAFHNLRSLHASLTIFCVFGNNSI